MPEIKEPLIPSVGVVTDIRIDTPDVKTFRVVTPDGKKPGFFARFTEFKDYLVLSRAELRKVSWPNWKETRSTSLVVLGFVVVMAILLGVVDFILSGLMRLILS